MNYKSMQSNKKRQGGFTLVEIAIVLMIIGLLIGGMLRGQELITSARVRNIIDQKNAIQTAQIGFMDRFRMLPGDLTAAQAAIVGNGAVGGAFGGNATFLVGTDSVLYFQNLVAAGFMTCAVCNAPGQAPATANNSPVNVFGGVLRVGQAAGSAGPAVSNYFDLAAAGGPIRVVLATGAGIESGIMREVDMKADDGLADTGSLRYGNFDTPAGLGPCTAVIPGIAGTSWATPSVTNCEGTWLL